MGYRSNLYIKATHDIAPDLYRTLQQADLISETKFSEDDTYTYVTLYDLKWYDTYDDVRLINTFVDSQPEGKITMIREGEESGDIETYGSDPSDLDLYYYTTLAFDGFDSSPDQLGTPRLRSSHPELFI